MQLLPNSFCKAASSGLPALALWFSGGAWFYYGRVAGFKMLHSAFQPDILYRNEECITGFTNWKKPGPQ